jgi:DHA2 family multidrug resistance protein-like MFS transporter
VFLLNVPVALVGLAAVAALMPESRAAVPPGLDPAGVVGSAAGLVALTYGLIKAGEDGWDNAAALLLMFAGIVILVGFFTWERRLNSRPGGQPLLDLSLFGSASFTWGVILAAVGVLSMIGVLFTMPQYFQGVLGTDAMGSGLRLLPLIGGLTIGAVPADLLVRRAGATVVAAAGFVLIASGLFLGATTGVRSSGSFVAAWMAIVGVGMGLALATVSSAALAELSEERSGVGSAVLQAVNKVGGPFGTAILGSVLSSGYLAHLDLSGLPTSAATAVRQSVFGGVVVANQLRSAPLLESVRTSFVHGMDAALLVSASIAVTGALLTVLFLPRANATQETMDVGSPEEDDVVGTR